MSARLLLLLAACAGLSVTAVTREAPVLPIPGGAPAGHASLGHAPIAALPDPPRGPWAEQAARPLFIQDRRPPATPSPPPPLPPAALEPPPPLAAAGVALRSGGALALLRLADNRVVRVREGDEVDGWAVSRISSEGVDLTRGERTVTLTARVAPAGGLLRASGREGG